MPGLGTFGERQRPVEEVTNMRKNFCGRPRGGVDLERREALWYTAHGFAAAIGNRGERVSKQLAFLVHRWMIIAQLSSTVVFLGPPAARALRATAARKPGYYVRKIKLQQVTAPSALAISLTSTVVIA